jgi:signal transduction histidine kinase
VLTLHLNADRQLVGYIKMLRDRTDVRMRHEALRNRAARLARELRQEREAFATFAHELRNPLAPILNAARIANGDADEGARRRMLDVIVRQTEVIQRLMRDAVERRPVREQRLEMRPLVLQAALKSAVDAVAPEAEAFGLQLLVVMPDTPITLEADPARMQQMVGNLLGNALKYTPRGGHVTVSAGIEGDMAVVRIDDNGEGIAKDNLERVFELFTREESNDIVPGIGVGLAVVKQLAQLHGGFVEARSPGKGLGSQFALQLPLRQAGAA